MELTTGAILRRITETPLSTAAEGDDDRLLLNHQNRGLRLFRASRQIADALPLTPLRIRFLVHLVTLRQRPQALLNMLYCSKDRLRRRGAPVRNLSHSASLHAEENNAPSKSGIKHLGFMRRWRTSPDAAVKQVNHQALRRASTPGELELHRLISAAPSRNRQFHASDLCRLIGQAAYNVASWWLPYDMGAHGSHQF